MSRGIGGHHSHKAGMERKGLAQSPIRQAGRAMAWQDGGTWLRDCDVGALYESGQPGRIVVLR